MVMFYVDTVLVPLLTGVSVLSPPKGVSVKGRKPADDPEEKCVVVCEVVE